MKTYYYKLIESSDNIAEQYGTVSGPRRAKEARAEADLVVATTPDGHVEAIKSRHFPPASSKGI